LLHHVKFLGLDYDCRDSSVSKDFQHTLLHECRQLVHLSITAWSGRLTIPKSIYSLVIQRWFTEFGNLSFYGDKEKSKNGTNDVPETPMSNPSMRSSAMSLDDMEMNVAGEGATKEEEELVNESSELGEIKLLVNYYCAKNVWLINEQQVAFLNRVKMIAKLRIIHFVMIKDDLMKRQYQDMLKTCQYKEFPVFDCSWHDKLTVTCPPQCANNVVFGSHFPTAHICSSNSLVRNPYYDDEQWRIRLKIMQCSDMFLLSSPSELNSPR